MGRLAAPIAPASARKVPRRMRGVCRASGAISAQACVDALHQLIDEAAVDVAVDHHRRQVQHGKRCANGGHQRIDAVVEPFAHFGPCRTATQASRSAWPRTVMPWCRRWRASELSDARESRMSQRPVRHRCRSQATGRHRHQAEVGRIAAGAAQALAADHRARAEGSADEDVEEVVLLAADAEEHLGDRCRVAVVLLEDGLVHRLGQQRAEVHLIPDAEVGLQVEFAQPAAEVVGLRQADAHQAAALRGVEHGHHAARRPCGPARARARGGAAAGRAPRAPGSCRRGRSAPSRCWCGPGARRCRRRLRD